MDGRGRAARLRREGQGAGRERGRGRSGSHDLPRVPVRFGSVPDAAAAARGTRDRQQAPDRSPWRTTREGGRSPPGLSTTCCGTRSMSARFVTEARCTMGSTRRSSTDDLGAAQALSGPQRRSARSPGAAQRRAAGFDGRAVRPAWAADEEQTYATRQVTVGIGPPDKALLVLCLEDGCLDDDTGQGSASSWSRL